MVEKEMRPRPKNANSTEDWVSRKRQGKRFMRKNVGGPERMGGKNLSMTWSVLKAPNTLDT